MNFIVKQEGGDILARPQKEGLEYFPLDVDFDHDDKLIVPIGKFGMIGLGIIVKLMAQIYKNGYFYAWSVKEQYAFANRVNVDINLVNDVVNECVAWGFFQQAMFEDHHILTSKGFQKRYVEAAKRRKEVVMIDDYILIDPEAMSKSFNVNITIVNADGNQVNVYIKPDKSNVTHTETPQSKVNKSKSKVINKKKLPRQQKTYAEDSTPYKMALYLHSKIMAFSEEIGVVHLVRDSKLQSWADDCRKLLELDKRDKDEIRRVIDWTTQDTFWRKNILSPDSLRKQYAKLCIAMADEVRKEGGSFAQEGSGNQGRRQVFGRGQGQGRNLQIADDELDRLQGESVQLLKVSGHGND